MNTTITAFNPEQEELISESITNYIMSKDFTIATSSIFFLEKDINMWLRCNDCGGIVVGRTRVGKTSALFFVKNELKKKYGEEFPVVMWELTEHTPTDKAFYKQIISILGIENEITRTSTAQDLRERTIRYLGAMAAKSRNNKLVLIIDEAQKLSLPEFDWLMDLYNCLRNRYGATLTVVFSATKEILGYRTQLITEGRDQIVERFFMNIHDFRGIASPQELQFCLVELDKVSIKIPGMNKSIKIAEFFFPEAYREEHLLFGAYATAYWNAFRDIKNENSKRTAEIPMEYFMKSFVKYLILFGRGSRNADYFLTEEHLKECIMKTNFHLTSDSAAEYKI